MGAIGFSYVPPAHFGQPTHCEITYQGETYRVSMVTIFEVARVMNEYPVEVRKFILEWCERISNPD